MNDVTLPEKRTTLLSNKAYFILENCALVLFPAAGTLYFALSAIWGLPAAQEVVGTIIAVDTFLGVVLKVGQATYDASDVKFDGVVGVTETGDKLSYVLNLKDDPVKLKDKDEIRLKVGSSVEDTLAGNT